jgi:dihydrofolate reductase
LRLSLIAAVSDGGVIGRDGGLPWHLPADLKHFKALTTGHSLLMGRKTYESVGKPLPRRRNIVLTRSRGWQAEGVEVAADLDEALALVAGEAEVFVAGGSELYAQALPRADRLYLTRVHGEVEGDVFFPEVPWQEWALVTEEHHPADGRHAQAFTFQTWDRQP